MSRTNVKHTHSLAQGEQGEGVAEQAGAAHKSKIAFAQADRQRTHTDTSVSGRHEGDQLEKVLKCNAFIFITACPQKYAMQKAQRTERPSLRACVFAGVCVCVCVRVTNVKVGSPLSRCR